VDVQGRRWSFLDKAAIFGSDIFRTSRFPLPGVIQCEIVSSSRDDVGAEILEVRLLNGVESTEGSTRFLVLASNVLPWSPGEGEDT
jgi:hypothetical protein